MKLIPLSKHSKRHKGKYFAMVNDEDYENVNQWQWHIITGSKSLYVARQISLGNSKQKQIKMHRQLLNVTDKDINVDHIDHDGLNNQRSNLRKCTKSQNNKNRESNVKSKSRYVGVCPTIWKTKNGKIYKYWIACININNKQTYLGSFPYTDKGEILAAKKYDEQAKIHYGNFANLNFK